MNCRYAKLISPHIDGYLETKKEKKLQEHLKTCKSCQNQLFEMHRLKTLLDSLEEAPLNKDMSAEVLRRVQNSGEGRRKFFEKVFFKRTFATACVCVILAGVVYGRDIFGPLSAVTEDLGSAEEMPQSAGLYMQDNEYNAEGKDQITEEAIAGAGVYAFEDGVKGVKAAISSDIITEEKTQNIMSGFVQTQTFRSGRLDADAEYAAVLKEIVQRNKEEYALVIGANYVDIRDVCPGLEEQEYVNIAEGSASLIQEIKEYLETNEAEIFTMDETEYELVPESDMGILVIFP